MEIMHLSCPTCNGTGEITQAKQEAYDFEQNMWCKCGNPSGHSKRWDDGEGIIHKHHYTCYDCGKITQVG
jgi:DnaJ-class molecular chaperone